MPIQNQMGDYMFLLLPYFAEILANTDVPVLWWIHEAETSYQEKHFFEPMPQHLPDNVVVYTGGEYAYKMLLKYKPLYAAKNLFYSLVVLLAVAFKLCCGNVGFG